MIEYSILLDGALAVLLFITIMYCWRLDGRLKSLRSGKDGMLQAARELQGAVSDAQNAISMLRQSSDDAGRDLQRRIEEARAFAQANQLPSAQNTQRPQSDFALRRRNAF